MKRRTLRIFIKKSKEDLYGWANAPYIRTKAHKIEEMTKVYDFYRGYAWALLVNNDITSRQYELLNDMLRSIYYNVRDNVK